MNKVKKITVVGAGTMGSGIVQNAVQSGLDAVMVDLTDEQTKKGFEVIRSNLNFLKSKNRITEDEQRQMLSGITVSTELCEAVKGSDLVIEAVPEVLELKQDIFRQLDGCCPPEVYFASCTSGISITAIASVTGRKDMAIGIHFTNPVPRTKGAAIITGYDTSDETLEMTKQFLSVMGKEYWVTKDLPGFSGTRIMGVYINEAFNVLMEGIASAEDIDKEMKMVLGHPLGPLELADFAGLDVILSSLEYLAGEKGDKYLPSPLLRQLVTAGYLGKKTGRGVYDYKKDSI